MTTSAGDFVRKLRRIFEKYDNRCEVKNEYLDLGLANECSREQIQASFSTVPNENPLSDAFFEIVTAMKNHQVALARVGINELLLSYLLRESQEDAPGGPAGETHLDYLLLLVLFITQEGFPYEHYFFSYLLKCYQPVCSFLLSECNEKQIETFMEHITSTGKIAAKKHLDTCSIHHLLRNIENHALGKDLKALASKAKDSRQTLEI